MEPQIRIQAVIFDRPRSLVDVWIIAIQSRHNPKLLVVFSPSLRNIDQNRVKIVSNVTVSSDHEPVMMVIKCLIRIRIIDHFHAWHSPSSNELLSARSAFLFETRAIVRIFEGIVRGFFFKRRERRSSKKNLRDLEGKKEMIKGKLGRKRRKRKFLSTRCFRR